MFPEECTEDTTYSAYQQGLFKVGLTSPLSLHSSFMVQILPNGSLSSPKPWPQSTHQSRVHNAETQASGDSGTSPLSRAFGSELWGVHLSFG